MASPEVMLTISMATVAVVYSFWCHIRISGKASQIRRRLEKEASGPWSEVNPIARNWNGGQAGIKLLHRKKLVNLPDFDEQVKQLLELERKMLWGIGLGVVCLALAIGGAQWWGWKL